MDWEEFDRRDIQAELARTYDEEQGRDLLERIDYPSDRFRRADNARQFWANSIRELRRGIIPDAPGRLVREAARDYPGNRVFNPPAERGPESVTPSDTGTSVLVTGSSGPQALIERAREIADQRGIPGTIELGFVSRDIIQLRFPEANSEQAFGVANALEEERLASQTTIVPNQFRDYLLRRLFVEGPDQGRFELNDVPASARNKDVVRAVMAKYDDGIWPRDGDGQARTAVIDQVDEKTGAHKRLEPEASLHDSGVEEDDTLSVAPQSTAGAVHPQIREEALARVRSQVMAYAPAHAGFRVRANAKVAPTEYLLNFDAPGWGPPGDPGGEPYPVDQHEILLLLPTDFPMQAPTAFWQTPIFHPNVHRETGKVCLGALEDRYRPGLHFGELCQILVDIASYRNYEIREVYDGEARDWAITPEGQMAIESRGGRSITRLLMSLFDDRAREPLPLRVKRCDS